MSRKAAINRKSPKREQPPSLAWNSNPYLGFFAALLAGLPFVAYYNFGHPWILLALAFCYIVTAILLQSRLIVGTLAGIFLALLFDTNAVPKDEMQLWQLIARLAVGVVIGIAAGVMWDRAGSDIADRLRGRNREPRTK